jgi:uncharacterized membrane protein YkvA (DUF1232 family)
MEKYQKNESMYKSNESILDWVMGAVKWLAYWALVVYYALQSPALPWKDKAKIVAALAYLLLPFDLLPDAIPVVGILDDAALLFALFRLFVTIDDSVRLQAREKTRQWKSRTTKPPAAGRPTAQRWKRPKAQTTGSLRAQAAMRRKAQAMTGNRRQPI